MRTIALILVGTLAGCTEDQISSPPPNAREQYAAVVANQTFLIAGRSPSDSVDAILGGQATGFWWSRITVPADIVADSGLSMTIDLAKPSVPVVFAQSYYASCDPSNAERTDRCWLTETYTAGETGLSGMLTLVHGDDGLQGGYELTWEGDTDRFDGPTQWLRREVGGQWRVSAGNVMEVPQ